MSGSPFLFTMSGNSVSTGDAGATISLVRGPVYSSASLGRFGHGAGHVFHVLLNAVDKYHAGVVAGVRWSSHVGWHHIIVVTGMLRLVSNYIGWMVDGTGRQDR